MGIELLLGGRDRQEVLRFTRQVLDPLLNDQKHRVLYQTLFRYVQEGKSAGRTADALQIHTNTLYQRLTRIETLTGRNIADAADFTLLSVACQLHVAYAD
jgi:DNA-binding PucR family transcriptional regulator